MNFLDEQTNKNKPANVWDIFESFDFKGGNTDNNDIDDIDDILDDISDDDNDNVNDDEEEEDIDESIISDFCMYCKTNTLIYDSGCFYCSKCGVYQQKRLSEDAEYRYYGEADNKSSNPERVGMPTNALLPESSLGSLIGYRSYDSNNFKKMIQYNSWNAMPYKERSQWKVFTKIANKARAGGLPNIIIEDAKSYYKTISETC